MAQGVLTCAVSALLVAGCSSSAPSASPPRARTVPVASSTTAAAAPTTPTTAAPKVYAPGTFDATDTALDQRVHAAGMSDGMIRIVAADGSVIHDHAVGSMSATTPLSIASSTKWLTAITLLTFVDAGAMSLDDDIARWLPEFGASSPPITARELLDHTSGVRDNPCQDDGTALASC